MNLGGDTTVPMPELRAAVESLGHQQVVSYIQSGNVAFAAAATDADDRTIARALEAVIAERVGVTTAVIVVRRSELLGVIGDNPFPGVADHRLLHAVFLSEPPGELGVAAVASAVGRAREKGSGDDARVVGRTLYLSTPDGFAHSVLRRELDRGGANRTPMREGTARNWATVTKLAALVDG